MKDLVYDGSFEGLLTTIFYAFSYKEGVTIQRKANYTLNLLNETIDVTTENDKFSRVYSSILNKLNKEVLRNVYYLYLCDYSDKENLILNYLKLCYKYGTKVNLAKNNDIIIQVDKYSKKVSNEVHLFAGFVRFKEIGPLSYYAAIEPDHNILPLLMDHFKERFSDQNFIIHDINREIAIIYNREEIILTDFSKEEGEILDNLKSDFTFEDLWKTFYNSVNIEERRNEKLRTQHMPKRYWSHLTEVEDS